jgi:hypothetical protein
LDAVTAISRRGCSSSFVVVGVFCASFIVNMEEDALLVWIGAKADDNGNRLRTKRRRRMK